MKVLITEDRRRELANKVLDDTLSKLTRKDIDTVYPGESIAFTITEQIVVPRGELCCKVGEDRPSVAETFKANIS